LNGFSATVGPIARSASGLPVGVLIGGYLEDGQQIRGAFRSQFCGRQSVNAVLIAIENRVRLSERIGQFMN